MGGFAPMPGQVPNGAPTAAPTPGMPANNMMPGVNPAMPNQTPQAQATAAAANPGKKDTTMIETIILVVVCIIAAAAIIFAVIFFMQYNQLKTNFDSEVAMKEAAAREEQAEEDTANFAENEKQPFSKFTGPSDFGSIGFEYPKTWSIYVASDGSNNSDYNAYFAPSQVNPIEDEGSRYALRFSIYNQQINNIQQQYDKKIEDGELTSSVFNADNNKISGTKYMGQIDENMQGIVVVFKVNDKTVVMQTDAMVYQQDFETLLTKLRRNS